MSPYAWIQTSRGRALDLLRPTPADIDLLGEVPDVLARLPRFGGHVSAGCYSVAQHCTLGADAILHDPVERERGAVQLARAFLLHDAHEFAIGDITSPAAEAMGAHVGRISGLGEMGAKVFRGALATLKADLDAAIYTAAGMPWPLPPDLAARVKDWDLRMLLSERRQLMGPAPRHWHPAVEAAEPARIKGRIRIEPWLMASDKWRRMCRELFPHLAAQE